MSLRKFGKNDIILNTMRTYPKCEFVIFDARVYYNNTPSQSGSRNEYVRNVPPGYISLYEYNIDRQYVDTGRTITTTDIGAGPNSSADGEHVLSASVPDTGRIYPWVAKGSEYLNLKTVSQATYDEETIDGEILQGTYPLSASITRELMGVVGAGITAGSTASVWYTELPTATSWGDDVEAPETWYVPTPHYRHYYALKNTLNHYGVRSRNYVVSSSGNWNKSDQIINMISIPQIFYGSSIRPGSLSLKWYVTGTLAGELQDTRQNGELRQVASSSEHSTAYDDECAGVVLYEEGFIMLTGSWSLSPEAMAMSSSTTVDPSWIYFGAGANDGTPGTAGELPGGSRSRTSACTRGLFVNASFNLSFEGETETPVLTMFSRAGRGEANYSNNATYLNYGQSLVQETSHRFYEENPNRTIYNTVSSSYSDYEAPFKRQVYISRVAIYDDKKNLIGVATLGSPVLKKEDQDITFKLRLDL